MRFSNYIASSVADLVLNDQIGALFFLSNRFKVLNCVKFTVIGSLF